MKDKNKHENGPRSSWGDWRAKRDQAIMKPPRGNATARLEKINQEARAARPATEVQ